MDFVFIANAWGAGRDNPTCKHQIALELARQGHRVLWLEGAGMRRPRLGAGADRVRIAGKIAQALRGLRREEESVWAATPLLIPLPAINFVRRFNGWLYRTLALKWCRRLGFVEPVLVNYVVVLAGAMRRWPGTVVYHCVDRWDAFEMYDSPLMAAMDAACCRRADVVIASSADLRDRCGRHNPNTYLVRHGVNYAHFASALELRKKIRPTDLPDGRIAGFIGLLSEWVDQNLIVRLARSIGDAVVVLIGPADVGAGALEREPNIRLLGPRPFAQLPSYVAHMDVGIIPFVVNDLTKAVNPIKLGEMLAAGCPVVAADLPEIRSQKSAIGERDAAVADAIGIAGNADTFAALVKERLDNPLTLDQRRRLSEAMSGETWETKAREIVEIARTASRNSLLTRNYGSRKSHKATDLHGLSRIIRITC